MPRSSFRRSLFMAAAVAVLLPQTLVAQAEPEPPTITRTQFGIGYVANAPEAMAGAAAYVILPRWGGVGVYVDAKFDVSDPTDQRGWVGDLTAEELEGQVGGDFVKHESSWWSVNAALVRPVSRYLSLYGGAGLVSETVYSLYNVALDSGVGLGGVAWVEDGRAENTSVNLMVGGITRLTHRMSAHFGFESKPSGITLGLSLRVPGW